MRKVTVNAPIRKVTGKVVQIETHTSFLTSYQIVKESAKRA